MERSNLLTDPERWAACRDREETRAFFQHLKDRQDNLMQAWGQGRKLLPEDQGEAMGLHHLLILSGEDLRAFYGIEEDGDGHGGLEGND